MKKFILAVLLVLFVCSPVWAARQRFTVTTGRAGAASMISGVSVGQYDTLQCSSGTTVEFFYAVLSGTSEIWPLAGGGITGFKLSDVVAKTYYIGDSYTSFSDSEVLQWKSLASAATTTPRASNAELTAHTTTLSGVSGEATRAEVAALSNSLGTSPWASQSTLTAQTGGSPWQTTTDANAAGAPLSTTGASQWGGVSDFIRSAVSEFSIQFGLSVGSGAFNASGVTPTPSDFVDFRPTADFKIYKVDLMAGQSGTIYGQVFNRTSGVSILMDSGVSIQSGWESTSQAAGVTTMSKDTTYRAVFFGPSGVTQVTMRIWGQKE